MHKQDECGISCTSFTSGGLILQNFEKNILDPGFSVLNEEQASFNVVSM